MLLCCISLISHQLSHIKMEKRENALREALDTNAYETERWEQYIKENEVAIENLNKFSQHLTVDVMVPVGKKMLMPGKLIHTNEALVGHFQGYFSKCSAKKATEICNLRIKKAKQHLVELKIEEELWLNNLEKPYAEGVMPTGYEQEIIEEYNEEREKQWRETHKISLRHHKMREKQERHKLMENKKNELLSEENNKNHRNEDVLKMLEERELIEELEQELENLEIDNISDETIKQIMSGDMSMPGEKKRIAHSSSVQRRLQTSHVEEMKDNKIEESLCWKTERVEKVEELHDRDEDVEFLKIKQQLQYLPAEDQQSFLQFQIKIVKKKLNELKLVNVEDLVEKTRLYGLLDDMQDTLGCIEDEEFSEVENQEIIIADNNSKTPHEESNVPVKGLPTSPIENKKKQKRRISFALNDETLEFRRNEAVAQLLPQSTREKISFDESLPIPKPTVTLHENKEELIRNRVEKNLKYVYENQSVKDLDLIDKIISESGSSPFPICINFQHYGNAKPTEIFHNDVPAAPSDFYKEYVRIKQQQNNTAATSNVIYVDGYKGEEEVHVPVLREAEYNKAYKKPLHEFSKSDAKMPVEKNMNKPIRKISTTAQKSNETEAFSVYAKVVGDVIDKTFTDNASTEGVPDPLPTQNFVDAHAPKKRISRFRQSREACKASS